MYTQREIRAGWVLHVFTASGVIVGLLGLQSTVEGHARAAILWLVVAMLMDGIDGPIARKINVHHAIPHIDGNTLDLIVDYFTCTIVPVAFLDKFQVLPDNTIALTSFAILLTGALWMARTDMETADRWFRGFPAEWNMIIPTLFLLNANRWVNLSICWLLCLLTMTMRVEFPHPVSVREKRPMSLVAMAVWIGAMVTLAIEQERQNRGLRRAVRARTAVDGVHGGRPFAAQPRRAQPDQLGGGVRAAVSASTRPAPWSALAAARSVAPVVATSSTTSTRRGAGSIPTARAGTDSGAKRGPSRRSRAVRPVCGAPSTRRSSGRHGTRSSRPTRRARTAAWSNPRSRRRAGVVGAHVTTSGRSIPAARAAPAACPASHASAYRSSRYFTRAINSRTTPS